MSANAPSEAAAQLETWEDIVAAARQHRRLIIRAGTAVTAQGQAYMEGDDTVCITLDKKRTGKGDVARFRRGSEIEGGCYLNPVA